MCLALFAATAADMPDQDSSNGQSVLWVRRLKKAPKGLSASGEFTTYEIGGHGCCCHFLREGRDDDGAGDASWRALADWVVAAYATAPVTLLAAWGGQERRASRRRIRVRLADVASLDVDGAWDEPMIVEIGDT